ncbi:hypothetical protein Poli38472_010866 [Pythium oligandrum]|uniref:Putative auto-transporter adhesin head GIN domain-containing protein n=1 Tax=Pythium oligandrum TaxID=41045 RepID=A0A8K1CEZ9_PYTOL|nr:hypothetical protein Poli38472_010866 [Pythium oligandrum]|eukprot:TMW61803.1 hypothetical protein Poli38472_010866 [Pythium oligandrum]
MHRLLRTSFVRPRGGAIAALAMALPFAYQVREHEVQAPRNPVVSDKETVEKRWELVNGASSLNRIKIDAPGVTFVSYEQVQDQTEDVHLGSIRVTSDSEKLVECVEVVPLPPNGVQLRFKSKECADLRGHLLTAITLARDQQVNELEARGGGVVVVEENVLVSDCEHARVDLTLEGSGSLFVNELSHDLNLKELRCAVNGSGRLQLIGGDRIRARDMLQFEAGGASSIKAFAGTFETALLKSSIAGSGAVTVVPNEKLIVHKLKTTIAGSGTATYAGQGECSVQRCSITGSGTVDAGGIQCQEASVTTVGSGKVTWNVAESLKASSWGSTSVQYVDSLPKLVEGKSMNLKPAPSVIQEKVAPTAVPIRETAFEMSQVTPEKETTGADSDTTELGKALGFLKNAFFGDKVTYKIDIDLDDDPKSPKA